jgi:hypothetical protein
MIAEQLDLKKPLIFEIPNILNKTECDGLVGYVQQGLSLPQSIRLVAQRLTPKSEITGA